MATEPRAGARGVGDVRIERMTQHEDLPEDHPVAKVQAWLDHGENDDPPVADIRLLIEEYTTFRSMILSAVDEADNVRIGASTDDQKSAVEAFAADVAERFGWLPRIIGGDSG